MYLANSSTFQNTSHFGLNQQVILKDLILAKLNIIFYACKAKSGIFFKCSNFILFAACKSLNFGRIGFIFHQKIAVLSFKCQMNGNIDFYNKSKCRYVKKLRLKLL